MHMDLQNLLAGEILALLMSYTLAQVVAWLYIWTHRGVAYSRNMVHSIVMLAMIVGMVMQVVGDSIARAFGLVGALAIIRFRTVVRDARDTTFIFLSLAVGVAVGAGHPIMAAVGTVAVGFIAVMLHFTGFGARHTDAGVLRVRTRSALSALDEAIGGFCRTHSLLARREADGEAEYSFEIRLFDPEDKEGLVRALQGLGGTTQVNVTMEERAEEW